MLKVFFVAYEDEINAIKAQTDLYTFKWNHHEKNKYIHIYFSFEYLVFIVKTDVGKVNAAASIASVLSLSVTSLMIEAHHSILNCLDSNFKNNSLYLEYINLGFACGLTNELQIGDVVHVNAVRDNDFDLTVFNYALGQVPNSSLDIKLKSKNIKVLTISQQKKLNINYYVSGCLTGNVFCNKKTLLNNANGVFSVYDMELFALAQILEKHNYKIKSYKIISDLIYHEKLSHEQLIDNSGFKSKPSLVLFEYFHQLSKSKYTSKINYRCIIKTKLYEKISYFFSISPINRKKS